MSTVEILMAPWILILWFVVIAGLVIAAYRYGWYRRWREFKAHWREWADHEAVKALQDSERDNRYLKAENEKLTHDLGQAQSELATIGSIATKQTVDLVSGP